MCEPKWRDAAHQRPDFNKQIWIWDNEKREKFFITFRAEKENWEDFKNNPRFPLWAYVWEI